MNWLWVWPVFFLFRYSFLIFASKHAQLFLWNWFWQRWGEAILNKTKNIRFLNKALNLKRSTHIVIVCLSPHIHISVFFSASQLHYYIWRDFFSVLCEFLRILSKIGEFLMIHPKFRTTSCAPRSVCSTFQDNRSNNDKI